MTSSPQRVKSAPASEEILAVWAVGGLLLATTVIRFVVGAHRPLWLDEVWTGMIAGQPTFGGFVRQCAYDVGAPLYYVIARLWAAVSGLSDTALRGPAILFGVAAPFMALWPGKLISRPTRLTWASLIACWVPGLWFSQDARCYTLLLFMAVANSIAFAALMADPTRRRAWIWTTVSSLLILTHYLY